MRGVFPRTDAYRRRISGAGNPHAKLTRRQALSVLKRVLDGVHPEELAEEFGITRGAVNHIRAGRSWTCLHRELPAKYRRKLMVRP